MNNKKNDKTQVKVINIIMTVLAILIIISTVLSNMSENSNKEEQKINVTSSSNKEEKESKVRQMDLEKLKKMGERDRMNYYFSYFVDLIENKAYETAYGMLYSEFKENYFNNLNQFIEYATVTFPKMANLNYTNIERNGDIYVLWVEVTDVLNGRKDEKTEINVVIRENDFADIEMSFTVI